jgi:hypothetical protein
MTDKPITIKGTPVDDVSFKILAPSKGMSLRDAVRTTHGITEVIKDAVVPHRISVLEDLTNCPRCNKPLIKSPAIDGTPSPSFNECPECGTLINTFRPTTYQAEFLRRRERYKMSAGGFGTGKSRVNLEDVIKHVLLIQGARVAVTGRSYPALQSTFIKEFYAMFPARLVRSKNESKHEIVLTNGSEIWFRSFDDFTKMKSMNLTMVVIVEASDCPFAGFTMMQSRIRNTAAMIPEYDHNGAVVKYYDSRSGEMKIKYRIDVRHISLETNPDSGWVKTEFLLDAKTVEFYGDAYNEGYKYHKTRDKYKYVQVVSTSANPYLPETYEEEQTRNKTKAYVQQFYKGSFNFSSNLVFPNFGVCIVAPHPLPREFDERGRRVLFFIPGLDYGINDPTHVVFTAFSIETRKLYVFDEYRVNDTDVKNIAKGYRNAIRLNATDVNGLLMQPPFDGRSYNKRESDLKTIGGMFEAQGLYFQPSFASHEARIIKMNALINHDQIEVFSTCEFLIEEALNYKFKLDKQGAPTKKPVDKKDHGITALEFVVVELPHNLQELRLSAYLPNGMEIQHDVQVVKKKKVKQYNPLEANNVRSNYGFINNPIIPGHHNGNTVHSIFDERWDTDEDRDTENVNRPLHAYIPRT